MIMYVLYYVRPRAGENYTKVDYSPRSHDLHAICEEARWPNISECWGGGTWTIFLALRSLTLFLIDTSVTPAAFAISFCDTRSPVFMQARYTTVAAIVIGFFPSEYSISFIWEIRSTASRLVFSLNPTVFPTFETDLFRSANGIKISSCIDTNLTILAILFRRILLALDSSLNDIGD